MENKTRSALDFLHHEAAASVFLLAAALLALLLANTPLSAFYDAFLETPVSVKAGTLALDKPLLLWINDGLMAIFFFMVGLEIKRELLTGELSTLKQAALPLVAAAGGMIAPALIYWSINSGDAAALKGWAIPTATDIAFAVGVLSLLGSRIPPALKVFLLALAIIDDLGAIIIIALFYTADLSPAALGLAACAMAVLAMLNIRGVARIAPYIITGLFLWICVLKSGVHATLAGVVTAFAIPLGGSTAVKETEENQAAKLEESLHPWVAFCVLPLFAFANAGVSLEGVSLAKLTEGIPAGIAAGLALGKPIGVFLFSYIAIQLGIAARPAGTGWNHIMGVALLAGIGFTMSLFIGMLAFPEPDRAADIRIGVLAGSLVSACTGYLWLAMSTRNST